MVFIINRYLYYKSVITMKKTINENTIKSIVRETLKNYLKESMDMNNSEGWTPDMDDMWDEFGNNNVHDTDGAFGVLAQGDDDDHVSRVARSLRSTKFDTDANMGAYDDEADEFASDDNAEYLRDKMFESIINRAVNEAFKKAMDDDDYDFQDRLRWCGDAKFHAENERRAKEKASKKPLKKNDNCSGKDKWCGNEKFHKYNERKKN